MRRSYTLSPLTLLLFLIVVNILSVVHTCAKETGSHCPTVSTISKEIISRVDRLVCLRKKVAALFADTNPEYVDVVSKLTSENTIMRMLTLCNRLQELQGARETAHKKALDNEVALSSMDAEITFLQKHLVDILITATNPEKSFHNKVKQLVLSPKLLIALGAASVAWWDLCKDKDIDTSGDEPEYKSRIRAGLQRITDNDLMSVCYMFACFGHKNINSFARRQFSKPKFTLCALVSVFFAVDLLVRGRKSFVGLLKVHANKGCAVAGQRIDSWFQKHPYAIFPVLAALGIGIYSGVTWLKPRIKERYDWEKCDLEDNPVFIEVMPLVIVLLADRLIRGDSSIIGCLINAVKAGSCKSGEYVKKSYNMMAQNTA